MPARTVLESSAGEASLARVIRSPDEFRTDLPNARITGFGRLAEGPYQGTRNGVRLVVADVPVHALELRVVKDIEEFAPNLESLCLRDRNSLCQTDIEIVDARTMKESAVRCPECPAIGICRGIAGIQSKRAQIKVGEGTRVPRVVNVNRPDKIGLVG